MRLPRATDLDSVQQGILDAPLVQNLFVSGPPGSGKTVVACYRAQAARKRKQECQLIMYNNVLSRYTKSGQDGDITSMTKDSWLGSWWKSITGEWRLPNHFVPGQRFHPTDYVAMQVKLAGMGKLPEAANWGHLVIDEGQDFPQDFYAVLNLVAGLVEGQTQTTRPVLTVVADENQRITEQNSTIAEIRAALSLADCNCHALQQNYRNTKRIAAFANHFSVGLETGTGSPVATRDGDLPNIVCTRNLNESVERIARYSRNHSDAEIGVLLYTKRKAKQFYNRLKKRLGEDTVQCFLSGDKELKPDKLEFDRQGKVTILCFASAKGLEFDAVFLPDLHAVNVSNSNEEIFKMTMFVMCSRARSFLELSFEQDDKTAQSVVSWLPAESSGAARWDTGQEGDASGGGMGF